MIVFIVAIFMSLFGFGAVEPDKGSGPIAAPGDRAPAASAPAAKSASTGEVDVEFVDSHCPDFGITGDEQDLQGGGYYNITATGINCDQTKPLVLGRGFGSNDKAEGVGFTCTELERAGETITVRCNRNKQSFTYSFGL